MENMCSDFIVIESTIAGLKMNCGYYVILFRDDLMKAAACIGRKNLISFGSCLGKFTKSGKFYLHITALDYLAPYAKAKVWLKPQAEQQFLYGNNIVKSGIGRMSEGIQEKNVILSILCSY